MRVTFVTNRFNLRTGGGSHRSLDLLARQLSHDGHQVRIVPLVAASSAAPDDAPYALLDPHWRAGPRLSQLLRMPALFERLAPDADVFHLYDPELALGGALYRRRQGPVPVVATLNGYALFCTNQQIMDGLCHRDCTLFKRLSHAPMAWRRRPLMIPSRLYEAARGFEDLRYLDRLLPVSRPVAQIYSEAGFDMRHSTVISDVIDFEAIVSRGTRTAPRPPSRAHNEPWSLLFVGRLTPSKGVDTLLEALALLDGPDAPLVRLHIVGDGIARAALEKQVLRLGLSQRVDFHGWVANHELVQVYADKHAFVHPGKWPDPCPRAVLECMAAGIPAIVSRLGGPPWMLDGHGFTFERANPTDLARTIRRAFEDYDCTLEMARQARDRAAAFDFRRVVPDLEQVYDQLVGAPAGA
jgi:glycosyltransferase involved in cell wall biosynthesis